MRKTYLYLSLCFLIACSKPAEIDLPIPESKLILDAKLFQGDSIIVSIDASFAAFGEENRGELDSNSTVFLFEEGVLVEQVERFGKSRRTFKSFYPTLMNKEYTIEVTNPSLGLVSGSTFTSNRIGEIISAELTDTGGVSELIFTLKDNASEEDAYLIFVKIDSIPYIKRLNLRSSDPSLRTFIYDGIGSFDQERKSYVEFYLNDDQFNGQEKEFRLIVDDLRWNEAFASEASIELVVMRIEPIWFAHRKSLFDQAVSFLGIFSEPARVVQNVEGGYGIVRSAKSENYIIQ
tara:strand:- start:2611 stop:3483 length:873 start_codon:yes stop_codon:yes gene_type:complete